MEEFSSWAEMLLSSMKSMGTSIIDYLPTLIGGVAIFFIGWLVAKFVSFIDRRILRSVKFDGLAAKINMSDYLKQANLKSTPTQLMGKIVFWCIMLLVIVSASEYLGWNSISDMISNLTSYLPRLFMAIAILLFGLFVASLIRDVISGALSSMGVSSGRILANVVFYFLMVMIALTSLEQAGFNTDLISSNLMLIMGALLLAGSVSYGFASRDVLSNILASYYNKQLFDEGMIIEVNGVKGKIHKVNKLSITIKNEAGENLIVPASDLISGQVKVFES